MVFDSPHDSFIKKNSINLYFLFYTSFIALIISMCYISFSLVGKIKYYIIDNYYKENNINLSEVFLDALYKLLSYTDFFILLLFSASLVIFIFSSFYKGFIYDKLNDTKKLGLVFIIVLSWLGHSYLTPGFIVGGDSGAHLAHLSHRIIGLLGGHFISWDNYWYLGQPVALYYSPATMWPIALLGALVGSVTIATKLFLFGAHVASGYLQYKCLRLLRLPGPAAMIGALIYAGAFAHLHQLIYRGTIPLALMFPLLPLALWLIIRLLTRGALFSAEWCGLAIVGGIILINYLPTGVVIGVVLAIFTIFYVVINHLPFLKIIPVITAALGSVIIAAFVIISTLSPSDYAVLPLNDVSLNFALPELRTLKQLVAWNNTLTNRGAETAAYLGAPAIILAIIAVFLSFRQNPPIRREIIWLFSTLFLVFLSVKLEFVRNILLLLFFFSSLSAIGAYHMQNISYSRKWIFILILFILIGDLSITAIQPVYRTDKDFLVQAGEYLSKNTEVRRVVLSGGAGEDIGLDYGSGASTMSMAGFENVTGGYNGAATIAHNYALAAIALLENELRNAREMSVETRNVLCMYRVSHIVKQGTLNMGLPENIRGTTADATLGNVLRPKCAYEVISAPSVVVSNVEPAGDRPLLWTGDFQYPQSGQVQNLLAFVRGLPDQYGLNNKNGAASHIPVRAHHAGSSSLPAYDRGPNVTVDRYQVEVDRIAINLRSDGPGYIRLSHSYHPQLSVTLNGREIDALESIESLLVAPIGNGHNEIIIEHRLRPLEKVGLYISMLGFITVIGIGIFSYRRSISSMVQG